MQLILSKKAIHIKSKDKISGVFKDTYYGIDFRNDDIILSKRGNYEFVNKDLSN